MVTDVLTGVVHVLQLLVHHLVVVAGLLFAHIDGPQLLTKSLHGLLGALRQIVDRLLHNLAIVHLLLVQPAPVRVAL